MSAEKAGSEQRYLLGIIARTLQLYDLIGQIDATGCDTTDQRTRTSKPGCYLVRGRPWGA